MIPPLVKRLDISSSTNLYDRKPCGKCQTSKRTCDLATTGKSKDLDVKDRYWQEISGQSLNDPTLILVRLGEDGESTRVHEWATEPTVQDGNVEDDNAVDKGEEGTEWKGQDKGAPILEGMDQNLEGTKGRGNSSEATTSIVNEWLAERCADPETVDSSLDTVQLADNSTNSASGQVHLGKRGSREEEGLHGHRKERKIIDTLGRDATIREYEEGAVGPNEVVEEPEAGEPGGQEP